MTTKKQPTEDSKWLDEIIVKLVGWGKNAYVSSPKRPEIAPAEAQAQILAQFLKYTDEIIGQDDPKLNGEMTNYRYGRNHLRSDQRQKRDQLLKEFYEQE